VLDAAGRPIDIMFSAKAKKTADEYAWLVQIDGRDEPTKFSTQSIELRYSEANLSSDHRYVITLVSSNKIPDVRCADTKKFQMHIEVFRKFLDNGEFDNNTVV
jgi:hypothetical protein